MICTEKIAGQKWCPIEKNPDRTTLCQASGCMLWVWDVVALHGEDKGHCGLTQEGLIK